MQPAPEYRPRTQFHVTDWRAALVGGLVAGIVFVAVQAALAWAVEGRSPLAPMQTMALSAFGPMGEWLTLAIAVAIHLPLSLLYGCAIGWLVRRLDAGAALLGGLAFGLIAIFGLNHLVILPSVFPSLHDTQDWITALPHAVFGVVAAAAYVALRQPDPTGGTR
jgi:hypothetical protein